jgi:fatty acid desaturase
MKTPLVDAASDDPTAYAKYPDLRTVRESVKVRWYRCSVDAEKFKEFITPSDRKGFIQAAGHLALYAFTGYLAYLCACSSAWLLFAIALFAHGTIGGCFVFGTHELAHGTVFKTKWLNKVFLYIYSLLSWWDPFDYAMSHTYHHRYTQHPDADRENLFPLNPSIAPSVLLQLFTVALTFTPGRVFGKGGLVSHVHLFIRAALDLPPGSEDVVSHEWLIRLHKDQPDEARKVVWWSRLMLLFHASVLVLSFYTQIWVLPLIVSFGTFFANWLRFVMGSTQHCGLRSNCPDFRKNTRSITLHPIMEFMYWNMNWHIEHHMFAQVPCYNLKALHNEVADDMPVPRTLIGAWRELRDIYERQQVEPSYEYDTPLPATKKRRLDESENGFEAAIGDLAPSGLKWVKLA